MKRLAMGRWATAVLLAGAAVACSHAPPPELVQARQAYARANSGTAARLVPDEVHKARTALDAAEKTFADEHDSQRARDLAYIAERKAQLAEALAAGREADQREKAAEKTVEQTQAEMVSRTRQQLQQVQQTQATTAQQLEAERQARAAADQQAQEAKASLAKLQAKEDARGTVITLSGSVLFRSNESQLMPTAQARLDEVAQALNDSKDRNVIVEGHTDSRGSASLNQSLSQRRAESVRDYLVTRGFPSERIQARGIGAERPVADNTTAEGRANNRRVEIVVQPKGAVSAAP